MTAKEKIPGGAPIGYPPDLIPVSTCAGCNYLNWVRFVSRKCLANRAHDRARPNWVRSVKFQFGRLRIPEYSPKLRFLCTECLHAWHLSWRSQQPPRPPAVAAQNSAGVTLMEMLVVLAIVGLLAGISIPSLSAGLDSVRMVSATDSVASFLNAAVNRAERRQEPIELLISTKDNALKLYSNEPGFTRELKMPEGVRIEAVLPKETDEEDGPMRLILLPGASVPGIGIQLANRRGTRRIVRLDPMTGFPHVESVIPQ